MVDRGRKLLATSTSYPLISWTAKMNGLALIATTLFLLLSIPTSVVGQKNRHFKEVQITVYPHELSIREGKEASFECRARTSDNAAYPEVRWTRVGGRLPENAYESGGRLSFNPTQMTHTGRYACVAVHQGRSVEAYATLHVQSYGPREFQQQNTLPDGASAGCMADEKACGSNECVKADYVCDGEPDCRDRSDEMNCPTKRHCEPNEFRCNNDRCVQKMWLCDGDDDCGDRSDEMNCKQRQSGDMCQPTEFKCKDGRQCVPQSFQCDGTNDCQDGSDEYGCAQPTVVQPPDSNKQVSGGSEFKLTCRAVGVPDPYINWRLNWGPVCEPPRCQQVSEAGVGTLTVQNAQPLDQGAYTCEAINVKGRVLATPDCIVRIVNIPAPPPPPPSRPQITCNPQGAFTPYADTRGQCQCKPQVEGPSCNQCAPGSFNLNEKSPQGCMKCFCFGITNQCRSSNYFRSKEKLFFSGDSQGIVMSDINHRVEDNVNFDYETYGFLTHKEPHSHTLYWKLPQRFMGDKVTAYGGQMSIQLQYQGSGPISSEPLVVLKGNGITLVHKPRDQESVFTPNGPFTVTIPTYEQSYEHLSSGPATREDLMMVLADLDGFLIRATHVDDQQSTSLGDVSWEIAVQRDTQDVRALEVEQCECPPGYIGTSCEDCAPGYERSGSGPYLGTCVPRRAPPAPQCSSIGAVSVQPSYDGRCQCKQNTVGATCDRCAPGSFHMAPTNPQGCLKCFCSGVANQCDSSGWRRTTVEINYARGAQDRLEAITKDTRNPFKPPTQPQVYDGAINFSGFYEARGQTLYWKLPAKFLGNKITSYGGNLKYVFRFSGSGNLNTEPDVIIRGNDITLHHTNRNPVQADRDNIVAVPIFEDRWQRSDGQPATREHLLMALADVDDVLIKMSYMSDCSSSSLVSVSLDFAEQYAGGAQALEVEDCQCPIGYVGTSCEDCAPGYSRTGGGLYLGLCEKCECHGHASECDKEYGTCVDCQHNTEGDQCERCKPGFEGDARRGTPFDCQQAAAKPPCQCYNHSPRGCDSFGRCLLCEHNTEGFHCETCKKGFYGDATRATPYDCTPCPCPGTSECFLDPTGQVQCRNCPAGFAGRLCDECAPGYSRSQASGGRDCEPTGRVHTDHIQFVPTPEVALRVEILPPKHLSIQEGSRAKWTCKVSEGFKPETVTIQWTKIGSTYLPPHAQQRDNQLIIDSVQASDAGQYRCTGTTANDIATDEASLMIAPPHIATMLPSAAQTQAPKPIVTPPHQVVDENQQAVFTCLTPGFADCEVEWHFNQVGGTLPPGVYRRGNQVFIPAVQSHHAGNYICTVQHQFGRSESNPGRLEINRAPLRPMVDPPEHNVEVNDPARFRCWVPGVPEAVLAWRPVHGGALPSGAEQRDGFLNFPKAGMHHEGQYICAAHDPRDDPTGSRPVDSEPVRLNIRQQQPTVTLPPAAPVAPQVDPIFQTVDLGQPATIRCWVPGNPNAELKWTTHHHGPLPPTASQHQGALSFPSVSQADDGGYICSVADAQTGQTTPSPIARLVVRQPMEKPLVDPPEQTVERGRPARIRCWVPNSPQSRLTWNKIGGQPLPAGARDDGRGNLDIPQTDSHHAGDYECSASDPNSPRGPPQVSDPATISLVQQPTEVEETGSPPRPVATPPVLTVKRGEEARFHCEANSQSKAEIHWAFGEDSGPLRGDTIQQGDDVFISAAEDADQGVYICSATNQFGSGRAEPVRLVVTDDEVPPTARVEPKVWNGKPGDKHQFKCHTTGIPAPDITWSKNGGDLPSDVVDLGDGVLEISNARKEHEGDYTCTATNPIGEASDFGTVSVGESLTVITNPSGPKIIFTVGEPMEIKCLAFGDPDPDVEWLHDPGPKRGDLPDDFVPVTISEQFIRHPKIGLLNAGRYTCKGSNQFASVTRDIYIEVVEPSHLATVAILGGSNQWFPVGQPAQLVCTASGSSLVDQLKWTKAGGGALPSEVEDQNDPGLLHFETFKPSHEGEYECHAYRKDELLATTKVNVYSDNNVQPDKVHVEISPPTVRVVNKGDSIVLDCLVHGELAKRRGHRPILYSWLHGDSDMALYQLTSCPRRILHLQNAQQEHSGLYRVKAKLEDGSSLTSVQPLWLVVITTSLHGHSDDYIYSWSLARGGSLIRQPSKESQLVVKSADPTNDYGIYRCEVENEEGDSLGSAQVAVAVGFDTAANPQEAKFDEASEAVLHCPVFVVPGATVSWSKQGDDLPQNSEPKGSKLVIENFDDTASGIYTCSVNYGQSIIEGFVNAKIFVPDTTIKVMLNVSAESVSVGDRVWLDCVVIGDANAQIEFSKDDADQLPSNAQVTEIVFCSLPSPRTTQANTNARPSPQRGPLRQVPCSTWRAAPANKKVSVPSYLSSQFVVLNASLGNYVSTAAPIASPVREVEGRESNHNTFTVIVQPTQIPPSLPPTTVDSTTQEAYLAEQQAEPSITTTFPSPTFPVESVEVTNEVNTLQKEDENARIFEVFEPIRKIVGEQVIIPCAAQDTYQPAEDQLRLSWAREDGKPLPAGYRIENSQLVLPRLQSNFSGKYRCIVEELNGQGFVSTVNLKVGDYIPNFDGKTFIEIAPLTQEQWQKLDLELSIKPDSADGIIFHAEKSVPWRFYKGTIFPYNQFEGVKDGNVRYTYNLGYGETSVQIDSEEESITVLNEEHGQLLPTSTVPSNQTIIQDHDKNQMFEVYLGGTGNKTSLQYAIKPASYMGSISRLLVNNKTIDIGASKSSEDMSLSMSANECYAEPCQNFGECVPAYEHNGFRCDCHKEFSGQLCQFRSRTCSNGDECAAGYCMDGDWGSNHCVCPLNRYGKFCELHTAPPTSTAFKFNGKTSFLAIPLPKKSNQPFSVELNVNLKPRQVSVTDQIIAYMGAEFGQEKNSFMALAIQGAKLVKIYTTKQGKRLTESVTSIQPSTQHTVKLLRTNQQLHIEVDGQKTSAVGLSDSGEHLYIGGYPPGIQPNRQISQFGHFSGCIDLVALNNEVVEAEMVPTKFLSGDLESCDESIQATSYTTATTTTTTTTPPTTTIEVPTATTTTTDIPSTTTSTATTEVAATPSDVPGTTEMPTTTTSITTTIPSTMPTVMKATTLQPAFDIYPTVEEEDIATLMPFIGLCDLKTCGDHGDCDAINSSHVVCSCRDYYTGPTCEEFKPIGYAARFQGNAFVVFSGDDFPHLTSEKEEIIELRLKTSAKYGVIFWQGQHPESTLSGEDYVSIGLNDGYLLFSYELGGGAAQLMSQLPVNDGREHVIRASRKGRNGTLLVDGHPPIHGTSSGILAMLNVEGNIYIGGLPDLASMTAGLHTHNFVGCIADILLNEQKMDLMTSAIDGRNVRACDSWRKTKKRFSKTRRRSKDKRRKRRY